MKLGVYNAILHDRPLEDALAVIAGLGLEGIEVNSGGFLPPVHIPEIAEIAVDPAAARRYLARFEGTGVSLAGLNCNGNPLHPNPTIGARHADDIRTSIRAAAALGQDRVVTMSGLPGGEPGATRPNWVVNAWNSAALDVLDYQWEIAAAFWTEIDQLAKDHGVKVALELHPQNLVFNTRDVRKLVELTGVTHVGVELDASHLINTEHARLNGVLDNGFRRLSPDEPRTNLGGDEWANEWPKDSSWDFVALGKGHDAEYWAEFIRALTEIDPDMWLNIEHEDTELGRVEGLEVAAAVLNEARTLAS